MLELLKRIWQGQPFTITCISLATFGEKYKFSWTKDKSLLPIKTETEHYEILYPGGSILQVAGLNVSGSFLICGWLHSGFIMMCARNQRGTHAWRIWISFRVNRRFWCT